MKSFAHIGTVPFGQPLSADDITELHAGRILLLLKYCGVSKKITGLTKLAKLDFFSRYPDAFSKIAEYLGHQVSSTISSVESPMVRHHYGPWDKRYYQILAFLESRELITIHKKEEAYVFELTPTGNDIASELAKHSEFSLQLEQMKKVKSILGAKSGSSIKSLIYTVFEKEVTNKPLGEII